MAIPRYNVIVKIGSEPTDFAKYRNVTNLRTLEKYCDEKFPDWRFINVYDGTTEEFVECIKRQGNSSSKSELFNVIVRCSDGRFRKWKTSDCMDFLRFLNSEWTGWHWAKFYHSDTRKLWRTYENRNEL